ncbi:MAG: type II secretion system F family protein [Actinomycetales bacterium]|nr:type II secretion system F family protein [Actinomycetales bacterium]
MTAYLPLLAFVATLLAVSPPAWFRVPQEFPRLLVPTHPVRRSRHPDELAWVEALVAELGGGRDPASALVAASASYDVCPAAVAAARGGGDVATALASADASALVRGVAACWEVAHGSGAGLASSLATLADAARETERIRGELRAGLAEPRATALVLAALPGLGLLLGSALGADPWHWLLGSTPGLVVLTAGIALEGLGTWWAWRITVSLEAGL